MTEGIGNVDINTLSNALAQVLVNAIDASGDKESNGWDQVWQKPFEQGVKQYTAGQKLVTGTPNAVYAHGPGGIFSTAGIDNLVVNAHLVPEDLDQLLRVFPTIYMNPLFPALTGFSEDDGDEPDGVCDTCLGGTMQACNLTAQFGHVCRTGDEIHITRTMQMINRGETTPLTLLGEVLGPGGISKMPNTPSAWLEVVTRAEMVKIAILIQRWVVQMTWRGNPANNTAGGGYMEFPGLETLVGTGKVDATTNTACEALDSYVLDWAHNPIGGTIDGRDIVQYLSHLEFWIRFNAQRMRLMPVQWVWAMTPSMWEELTAIWACRYLTDRCTDAQGAQVAVINDDTAVRLRDAMRNGLTLKVNGRTYPVVLCDGMTEEHGDPSFPNYNGDLESGQFASDIFFLPLKARGGMDVLYWEHLDYSKAAPHIALSRSQNDFWTDGGRFLWTADRRRGCYVMDAETDIRIILRTPHLAGRLDNVMFEPLEHLRSPFYGDPYFRKGGVSSRDNPADSWYNEWTDRQ